MYYDYFGLNQPPFKITPDTKLFFPGGNRGAILEALIYAITSGEGIVKVVGEVGTGKTMLCRMLEVELADNIEVVYLANPSLSPDQIPNAIAFELKLENAASDNRLQVMNDLQNYLLEQHAQNRQVVVFVEEAQSMPLASLEELRLLSNLETNQNKLLQIVLFGQPELDEMIATPEIRQLKERITYSFQLSPFKASEINEYLNSRLRACGYRLGEMFHDNAVKEIGRYSNGLLRRINILADKSLLAAYASNTNQVGAKHVHIAARDSEFVAPWKRYRWAMIAAAVVITILISMMFLPKGDIMKLMGFDTITTNISENALPLVNKKDYPLTKVDKPQIPAVEAMPPKVEEVMHTAETEPQAISENEFLKLGENTPKVEISKDIIEGQNLKFSDFLQEDLNREQNIFVQANHEGEQLMALDYVIKQQDLINEGYSETELNLLIEQLERVPSEALIIDQGASAPTCERCSSIIYRPLFKQENL